MSMNAEQVKTMVDMAKVVDDLKGRVTKLEGKQTLTPSPIAGQKLTSEIEHELDKNKLKIAVNFKGYEELEYSVRMMTNEEFLHDMLELLRIYKVTELQANYGTQLS